MKIAAGVLIIVVGAMNLFASFGYMFVGGIAGAVGEAGESIMDQGETMDGSPSGGFDQGRKVAKQVKSAGGMLSVYGFLLLVLAGIGIAAGVLLFQDKAAMFILITGGAHVLVMLLGFGLSGFTLAKLFCLGVGGFVAFVGFTGLQQAGAQGPPQTQPPMPPA